VTNADNTSTTRLCYRAPPPPRTPRCSLGVKLLPDILPTLPYRFAFRDAPYALAWREPPFIFDKDMSAYVDV